MTFKELMNNLSDLLRIESDEVVEKAKTATVEINYRSYTNKDISLGEVINITFNNKTNKLIIHAKEII
jgi:hypothetical protein